MAPSFSLHEAMPKNKKPVPRKSAAAAETDPDVMMQALADLALAVVEAADDAPAQLAAHEQALDDALRKALRKKRDEVLYGAIDNARYTDPDACRLLQDQIGELAATLRLRREGESDIDIDAFLIPLFVRSNGGLVQADCFADDAAYEALVASFQDCGLESPAAKVALVRHAYTLAEIDQITYSALQELLREASATLSSKKPLAAPLLAATIRADNDTAFAAGEDAMELRFLFGFAQKRADDAFYAVPQDEIGADVYFADRMRRYRAWTERVSALVQRSLARTPAALDLNFLYQDLFYGAKEQGVAELAMLACLSEISGVLAAHAPAPEAVRAVVAPQADGAQLVLRVNLYPLAGGAAWAGVDKPLDLSADLGTEVDALCDALGSLGIVEVASADGFDADGQPEGAQAYPA